MRPLVVAWTTVGLALFVVLPVGLLTRAGISRQALAIEPDALLGTLALAGGTGLVTGIVGTALGVAWARYALPGWLVGAFLLAYATPPYVTTIAWIALANPTTGWLRALGPVDIYTLSGMIVVLGGHLTPIVALAVRDAARRIDPAWEEAARLAGAGPAQVLRDVILPVVAPAALTAVGFVTSAAAASFGVPYLLSAAAADPTPVLTTRIQAALDLGTSSASARAAGMALLLGVVGLGAPAILRLLAGQGAALNRPVAVRTLPTDRRITAAFAAWVAFTAVLPLATVALTSVLARTGTVLGGFTLDGWGTVLGDERTRSALLRSLWLAAAAATVTVGTGALLGHAIERSGSRWLRGLALVGRLPYALPGTVLALGILLAWSAEVRFILADRVTFVVALADTLWLLGLAYAVRFLALPLDQVRTATRSLHPSLEEAAAVAGASPARVVRDVTAPLLAPALRTAWFLVFSACFCEVTLSVLLRGPATEVLGTRLFYLQSYADPASAAVLACIVGGMVAIGLATGGSRGFVT